MKKKILSVALMCSMAIASNAQIYGYDSWTQLPTRNIYDEGLMNMHLRVMSETAARRQEIEAKKYEAYQLYGEMAVDAFSEKEWGRTIQYVDKALDTGYYCGDLYYMRGYAYEQCGYVANAKADYKRAKKLGSTEAVYALERISKKENQNTDNRYFSK